VRLREASFLLKNAVELGMAKHRKSELIQIFEESVRHSGRSILRLSASDVHPARYQIANGSNSYEINVYIWNLTFGGRRSIPDEWRIQVTGLPQTSGRQQFSSVEGVKTVVLGWCDDLSVFAAYDIKAHLGPLGGSPSIQIRQQALESARINGLSHHIRGEREIAFGVKPEFMCIYLDHIEDLHACGSSEAAIELLSDIFMNPPVIDDIEIEQRVSDSRSYAIVSTKKALRDANFNKRVLTAYSNACAMCGTQLRLLDAAHILPAAHPDSTDETSNGISLCALHHRAFDRGLITFDGRYRILINDFIARDLMNLGLDGGLQSFRDRLFPMIEVPPTLADRPNPRFIERVNAMRGWVL
jgi:putative restriction endonuclease